MVVICKGVSAEPILSSYQYIEKSTDYEFLHPWLGTGLLTSTGAKWRSRRKFLTPAFHFQVLTDFMEVFYEQSQVMVRQLAPKARADEIFDICPFITRCTLDIISGKLTHTVLKVVEVSVKTSIDASAGRSKFTEFSVFSLPVTLFHFCVHQTFFPRNNR